MAVAGKLVDISSTVGKVVASRGEYSMTVSADSSASLTIVVPYDCYLEKGYFYSATASQGYDDLSVALKVGTTTYASGSPSQGTTLELAVSSTYRNTVISKGTAISFVITNSDAVNDNTLADVFIMLRLRPANIADGPDGNLWYSAE